MDGDSLFGGSTLIMENGINGGSWNPFRSKPQDYDIQTEDNSLLSTIKGLTIGQSNGVHQTPPIMDFNTDPFPAPDWVFSPPHFYQDVTTDDIQPTEVSDVWGEEADIFQPFNEKAHTAPANQNTEPSSRSDPLLDFILSRQKNVQATPSFSSQPDSPSVFQDTPTHTNGFFHVPDVSNDSPTSDEVFPTFSSNAGTNVSDIKVFDPLFDDQYESSQNSHSEPLTNGELANGAIYNMPETPSPNSSNGDLFRRRPPKPTPRSKAVKSPLPSPLAPALAQIPTPPLTPVPAWTPAPTPRFPRAPSQVSSLLESDQVYENVLLIGQERCVEDWPEDSPELSSEWKPAGKIRLRRDSLRHADGSDGGVDGKGKKNGKQPLGKKLKHTLLIRRSSKDKLGDEVKVSGANTNSLHRGAKLIDVGGDEFFNPDQDEEQNESVQHKSKKSSKPKIITQRRGSKTKSTEAKGLTPDSKDDLPSSSKPLDLLTPAEKYGEVPDVRPKSKPPALLRPLKDVSAVNLKSFHTPPPMESKVFPKDAFLYGDADLPDRRQSPEMSNEERNAEGSPKTHKTKRKSFVKFVPQRGFVIGLTKSEKAVLEISEEIPQLKETDDAELKGAWGFTPDLKDQNGFEDHKGSLGFTPHEMKEDTSLKNGVGHYSPHHFKSSYSNGFMGASSSYLMEDDLRKDAIRPSDVFMSPDDGEKRAEMKDCRPKKPGKFKVPRFPRKHAKSQDEVEIQQNHESSEMRKPPLLEVPPLTLRDSQYADDSEGPQRSGDDEPGWIEYTPDNKPQKSDEMELDRGAKNKELKDYPEDFLNPPGATAGDYFLSEAAKAEWTSAQMDMKRLEETEDERNEEEEEDTDSLMEWWNTEGFWEEVPPNETTSSKEEETISFKAVAEKVHCGLRVYLKLFMERAELLYQHVLILYSIADDLSNFHSRAKIANITGGTTTAIGGAAAIAGLALAPATFGASILISAIGLGVATAGGITAASASISDSINNMHDRKKIEIIIQDYETQLVEMQHCLKFINEGLSRLRFHPLLRRNNYFTGDWEVRRALQTISLVSDPVERALDIIHSTLMKFASLQKGIDKYFTKDSKEVKKGCKKEVTAEVRTLAKKLQDGLVELNSIREQLLDASGNI